jgi:hypothetical protein
MVFKLIGKLLFKATIPLLIVAGLFTYGMSTRGGDPVAMWKGFGSNVMDQLASLFSEAKDDAATAAAAVAKVGEGSTGIAEITGSKRTKIFTWKDANGVTQYSNVAPSDFDSKKLSINPNTNVMAPVEVPEPVKVTRSESEATGKESKNVLSPTASRKERKGGDGSSYSDPAVQDVANQLGGELPGVVGQILSTQGAEGGKALNPAQLLKMLQQ